MKEPILIELTAREAITMLSITLRARHELKDNRQEIASIESHLGNAIREASKPVEEI